MNQKEILVALRRITRAIDLHSKQLEKSAGLTVPQLLVLQALDEADHLSVSAIALQVNLSQGTVTSVLERMTAKGLVDRVRDPDDRRRVRISLSSEGEARLRAAPGLLQESFMQRFEQLEPWEQKMLTAAVERIASMMDAQAVDASPILQVGEILAGPRQTPER
ncbi:MAG: MarR family winged helix-turn-helix transcriptional regulator [Gammaproteobacteria bacterium]